MQLPIQTSLSVAPELQVFVSSLENCQIFSKTSTPPIRKKKQTAIPTLSKVFSTLDLCKGRHDARVENFMSNLAVLFTFCIFRKEGAGGFGVGWNLVIFGEPRSTVIIT